MTSRVLDYLAMEKGCGQFEGTCLEGLRKTTETLVRIASSLSFKPGK
jgi:hypothetical protein